MASGGDPPQLPRGLIGRTGTPSARGGRLPSIRGPRDLTLGGVQKKVFTPNIPARRAKPLDSGDGDQSSSKSKDDKPANQHGKSHRDRGRGDRGGRGGRGRNERGRGRMSANVIQTHSLFEQGPTEKTHRPSTGNDSVYSGGGRSGSSASDSNRMGIKKEKIDSADSKQVIDNLLRDDFITGHGGLEEEDVTLVPVRLPLEMKSEPSTKSETDSTTVKSESMEAGEKEKEKEVKPKANKTMNFQSMRSDSPPSITCADLFTDTTKSENGELLLFQLPDMLPGLPLSTDEDFRSKKSAEKKDEKETELDKKMKSCGLDSFCEGLVGKLVVRKSGRVQLYLGATALDVNLGANCGFLQDLVSVRVDGDHGSASILGHVSEHSLVCTPDFDSMLDASIKQGCGL